ncbi:MAG: (p)ppGpp synthetase [Peptococcaceae bacterium BICA1-7]|nr:MAG: (p)ppGpp synthetase [Peptococcaceae bacterium BICA1-7]HBV95749.1 bifunctional (p)ppGpp synthetase/guanosine-3',5'-bis(diphosphate) 3'-pyrophosphohydrolase [Desulfotomaculum sp.]
MTLDDLVQKLIHYNPQADLSVIRRAFECAREAHKGQTRISGEEYITHPLSVAMILAEIEMDEQTLLAALLHDVVEDTSCSLEQISSAFGEEVALMVDGVTKLGKLEFKSKEEQQAENLRKMFLAMAKDIRVILIKLADRLHNMRTLRYQSEKKQKEIALETIEIYAPLAHRLGIYHLKWELEDLSFRYLYPDNYYQMAEQVSQTRVKREEFIINVIQILREKLAMVGIEADIQGRPKHLYSIYEKMKEQQKELSEIYDVLAVRILVHSIRDCYASLGTVHTLWKPIPGRFRDFIAMPKTNMYQSLHTTVVGPQGEPLEIQIRTVEMHRTAEYGIAAHWRYKEGGRGDKDFDKKLAWLRQLLEWQHDLRDAREFMETLKVDLFADAVFVFTPKGDVYELPAGSVPIDFAYRVHTQVGHSCVGAKVNGRIVPLEYKLKNGDIVEVITSRHPAGPSRDWINMVKTSQAKNRIRQWFKKEHREENMARGKELLEREAKRLGMEQDSFKDQALLEAGKRYTLFTVDDVYASIGEGSITATTVLNRIREGRPDRRIVLSEKYQALVGDQRKPDWGRPTQGIKVRGVDNLLIRLAHCCNPIPGDPIVGYITRGRGVSIHRGDCRNLQFFGQGEDSRLVEVAWDSEVQTSFQVKLEISGSDRAGLLSDILAVLVEMKISANWINARGRKDTAIVEMILEMKSKEQLEYIISKINRVKDVYEVRRTS